MATGTVKRIQRDKGWLGGGSFDDLSEGQRVSFDEEQSSKGPRAANVRPE